ncbi:MAG: hypothetical protein M4579_007406 [Chaenotheca gracillima]|nr:MAG: hypothetical protein M4579_007406 [Chaenotheca gracillima]
MRLSTASSLVPASLLFGVALAQDQGINNCPGVMHVGSGSSSVCCVGGDIPKPTLSTCPGWPMCTGPATVTPTTAPLSCATVIPMSTSGYESLVSAASESLAKSGTHIQTTINDMPITSGPATATGSAASSSGQSDSGSGASTTAASAAGATSTGGAMGLSAELGLCGGALIAAIGML